MQCRPTYAEVSKELDLDKLFADLKSDRHSVRPFQRTVCQSSTGRQPTARSNRTK
jgi:hypothetical protein